MDEKAKSIFEGIVDYFSKFGSLIPLSFVLGFYIELVMERWWNQYNAIPYPDTLATLIGASIQGEDVKSRAVKRTIGRYVCVTFTMTLTMISSKVKKRFPTLNHFVKAGLLTNDEKKIIEELDDVPPRYTKYWLPIAWASSLVITSRRQGLIRDDGCVDKILEELNNFRSKCGTLLNYDWISIPLVYTQVVTIAVYSYFVIAVVGNQYTGKDKQNVISSVFPLIPVLEFFFYMGWLKVAETLTNPFGDDDDDFEVMWMVDRHMQIVYLLVDKIPQKLPKLTRDLYWNTETQISLPYTKASENYMSEYPVSSTNKVVLSPSEQEIVMPETSKVEKIPQELEGVMMGGNSRTLRPLMLKMYTNHNSDFHEEIQESTIMEDEIEPICEAFEKLKKQRENEQKRRFNNALLLWKQQKSE
ncbi:hypothetical protein WA026_009690 [Henosepilachna vigintioctopunctata]